MGNREVGFPARKMRMLSKIMGNREVGFPARKMRMLWKIMGNRKNMIEKEICISFVLKFKNVKLSLKFLKADAFLNNKIFYSKNSYAFQNRTKI